ncbi:MAG: UvrD-helicase domain-containing protein [Bdellovibrionales bacterium]|nr:UvrD-helicase domain-containing protein [Bdellovibrionales bacterium]
MSDRTLDFDFNFDPEDFTTSKRAEQQTPVDPDALPNFVTRLNEPQREAVLTTEGPLLVLAGAGSGKTRMLTSRIAYLISVQKIRPWQILAVTFTNKAAGEMRDRVCSLLNEVGMNHNEIQGPLDIGTFHAICARILRREGDRLPFTKPFVIFDDADQLSLLKSIVKSMGIDDKVYSPKSFQYAINRMKCDAMEPDNPHALTGRGIDRKLPQVYEAYQRAMIENNAMDFGEMITMTYRLLRDHADIREKYQRRYRYIHVDEYQDTNKAQYLLLKELGSPSEGSHGNICVVGDEDQSIYGWRGADIRNILDFERDYPGAAVVKLEQNYRSTQTIVEAASELIAKNTQRKNKTLFSEEEIGVPIVKISSPDDRHEAEIVVKELRTLLQDHAEYSLNDFAIIYRTHAQSRLFEEFLRQAKLAYRVVGGLRFFDRKEIKDVMAYLRLVFNNSDSISFKRIINVPARGIGKTTLDKLDAAWGQQGSLWDFFSKEMREPTLFSGKTLKKLQDFYCMVGSWIELQSKVRVSELYHHILDETRYVESLKEEGTDESIDRIENLEEFNSVVLEFEERELKDLPGAEIERRKPLLLGRFLEQTTLAESPDTEGEASSVQLMTFHGCKGLEFPVVFMVGMEEGLFPSIRGNEGEDEDMGVEEERRLCYVGMTRARERLYMSHATFRRVWGDLLYQYPARFFEEVPKKYFEIRDFSQNAGRL